MSEPTWTPEPTEDGVRFTLDAVNAAIVDLLAHGFTPDEAKALATWKLSADGESDDDHESR